MKKIFKTIAAIGICAALCAPLAACGDGDNDDGGTGDAWWTTTGELTFDENNEVVFSNVEINMSTVVNGEDKGPLDQLVAQFNAQYRDKITVRVTNLTDTTFESTVANQINNNSNAPDLIMSHQKGHKMFADNRLIQPLDEAMEKSGITIDLADYSAGLAQYSSLGYKDMTFGVPIDAQSYGVYYNKELLAKYGGELPASWEELLALCKKAKEGEGSSFTPIAWNTSLNLFPNYVFSTAILQNGGELYNTDTYYAEWASDPENLAAFEAAISCFRDLIYVNGYAQYGMSSSAALQAFRSDNCLFYFALPWNHNSIISDYADNKGISVDEAMGTYVGGTSMAGWFARSENEGSQQIYVDSHFFAMSNTVTDINKKAAILEFIRWFTQTESVGVAWAEAGHASMYDPVSSSAAYLENKIVSGYISEFYPDINELACMGSTPYYAEIQGQLGSVFANTVGTASSAQDEARIKTGQDEINAVVDFASM